MKCPPSLPPLPQPLSPGEEKPLHAQYPKHALDLLPITGCVAVCVRLCNKDHPEAAPQTLVTDTLRQPFCARCAKHTDILLLHSFLLLRTFSAYCTVFTAVHCHKQVRYIHLAIYGKTLKATLSCTCTHMQSVYKIFPECPIIYIYSWQQTCTDEISCIK